MLMNLVEAVNSAMDAEMALDTSVVVFGEDAGFEGGVFRATAGLQKKYGKDRCFDSILAESAIVGSAIGMAINGLRPVAEIQFEGFLFPALNQIYTHAARMRNRTRGKYTVPLVVRMPYGGGVKALEHHSEAPEALLAHVPGLKVVIPSTPYDAKGLLIAAIRDPDPVIFFEPKRIYRAFREEVPEEAYTLPIGKARILQAGTQLTVVTYGAMVRDVQEAVKALEAEGFSIEVIDLRTIVPYDRETVIASVKKTGRFAVVHEAVTSFGVGAELIAAVNEDAFLHLEAPPLRIAAPDIIVPLPRGEHLYQPNAAAITAGLRSVLTF